MSLLTRLQTSKTDKFSNELCFFFLYIWAIRVEGVTPDVVVAAVDTIQTGYVHFSFDL